MADGLAEQIDKGVKVDMPIVEWRNEVGGLYKGCEQGDVRYGKSTYARDVGHQLNIGKRFLQNAMVVGKGLTGEAQQSPLSWPTRKLACIAE